MSSVSIQGNASGTGIFTIASPNSNTNRTLTLPDNTGTVITTGSTFGSTGPAFRAHLSTTQTISTGVVTKYAAATEVFDTNSCYDTTLYRFTPNVAGYYKIGFGNWWDSLTGVSNARIYKNGSATLTRYEYSSGGSTQTIDGVLYMNGTTDYVELYVEQVSGSNQNLNSSSVQPGFFGYMVRSA